MRYKVRVFNSQSVHDVNEAWQVFGVFWLNGDGNNGLRNVFDSFERHHPIFMLDAYQRFACSSVIKTQERSDIPRVYLVNNFSEGPHVHRYLLNTIASFRAYKVHLLAFFYRA